MEKLTELLSALAEKFGTTTQYLWGVMVNQARIELLSDAVFIAVSLCVTVAYAFYFRFVLRRRDGSGEFGMFAGGAALIIMGF